MASSSNWHVDDSAVAGEHASSGEESIRHLSDEVIDQLIDNFDDTLQSSTDQSHTPWLSHLPPSWQTSSFKMTRRDQVKALLGQVPDTTLRLADGEMNKHLPDSKTYDLVVVEQPQQCRMSGTSNRDKRPIDPAPIVRVTVYDSNHCVDQESFHNPFFVLLVSLWSADRSEIRETVVLNDTSTPTAVRVLTGTLVSSTYPLRDLSNELHLYFAFPDLSVRTEGEFCLKFSLIHLGRNTIVVSTFSDVFTVYSAKSFPGMKESSELAKYLAKQGLKIPIRNKVRPSKARRSDPDHPAT